MLFNSIEFLIFLPTTFILYWLLKDKIKWQNLFILLVSYIFYGWWDVRFLSLIALSSAVDYTIGIQLNQAEKPIKRKLLLGVSLAFNLGLLGFFKYYNFFLDSFVDAFAALDIHLNTSSLNIILPVGISFYTFQTLSYTIDIYRKKMQPTTDPIAFFAYVSFFPQLVAGPIERASNLLPQFFSKRTISPALISDGLRQILWGMFKKIVIADNCAVIVDAVFSDYGAHNSTTLIVAAILFAFQIYGDFSGYSDIAIGTAKLFGFRLMTNFSVPYFSRDIAEFWRRWHISLSSWFRDYLYIPLGGSRGGLSMQLRNVFAIFIISGFWHGANWTFIVWGALNALLFLPLLLRGTNRKYTETVAENRHLPNIREVAQMLMTFGLTVILWIFFRSDSVGDSFSYLQKIAACNFSQNIYNQKDVFLLMPLISVMLIIEWLNRDKSHQMDIQRFSPIIRHTTYVFLLALIYLFSKYSSNTFIYFQF